MKTAASVNYPLVKAKLKVLSLRKYANKTVDIANLNAERAYRFL
jgi:hypothetical protein